MSLGYWGKVKKPELVKYCALVQSVRNWSIAYNANRITLFIFKKKIGFYIEEMEI